MMWQVPVQLSPSQSLLEALQNAQRTVEFYIPGIFFYCFVLCFCDFRRLLDYMLDF